MIPVTLNEYVDTLRGKRVAVVGVGVSNLPLIELLAESGVDVTACDRRSAAELGEVYDRLQSLGAKFLLGEDYLSLTPFDVVFRTPGLHPFKLRPHVRPDALVTSEMEVFFALCPCPILAVTGSDGKTTTTTLISELLKAQGRTVHLGGNIGKPLLCELPSFKNEDIAVLELSSFQLHSMACHPNVAVITNVSPNHLDVHPDFEDYQTAKKSIFARQTEADRLILNRDNALTRAYAAETKAAVTWFSRKEKLENGWYSTADAVYFGEEKIIDKARIRLRGEHNVENLMAAFAAVDGLVSRDTCRRVAEDFGGVAHRLELVRELRGVKYYNDSIASSPTRAAAGLRSFDRKVILIAGGHDKHVPFDEFAAQAVKSVKALFLCGETAETIRGAVVSAPDFDSEDMPIFVMDDFCETVRAAGAYAREGDIVLLSPACSSFDKFKNFVERGETFRKTVEDMK
ncbi:MAG: UDP-N-acetylmuramoyl-L-alanine--D-glutamate ligase [Oscillospiraceae bacterium]